MKKVWVIVRREYLARLRTRTFVVITLLLPLLYAAFELSRARLKATYGRETVQRLAIVGHNGDGRLFQRVSELMRGVAEGPTMLYSPRLGWHAEKFVFAFQPESWMAGESWTAFKQRMDRAVVEGRLTGYVIAPPEVFAGESRELQVYTHSTRELYLSERLRSAFKTAITEIRLTQAGVARERVGKLARPLRIATVDETAWHTDEADSEAPADNNATDSRSALANASVQRSNLTAASPRRPINAEAKSMLDKVGWWLALTWMMILLQLYSGQILRGVVEEKSSRIVEVLLSSVNSFQLMLGKLLGIGLVGVTQLAIWAALLGGMQWAFGWTLFESVAVDYSFQVTWQLGLWFVAFFLLGYFLCATLSLIVGALVAPETNATPALGLLLLFFSPALQVPLLIFVTSRPDSAAAVTLSLLPVFSPILMFARIAVHPPPAWQIGLALLLLGLTILAAVSVAAKIYRVSILAQGTPPTLRQLRQWLRAC